MPTEEEEGTTFLNKGSQRYNSILFDSQDEELRKRALAVAMIDHRRLGRDASMPAAVYGDSYLVDLIARMSLTVPIVERPIRCFDFCDINSLQQIDLDKDEDDFIEITDNIRKGEHDDPNALYVCTVTDTKATPVFRTRFSLQKTDQLNEILDYRSRKQPDTGERVEFIVTAKRSQDNIVLVRVQEFTSIAEFDPQQNSFVAKTVQNIQCEEYRFSDFRALNKYGIQLWFSDQPELYGPSTPVELRCKIRR